MRAMLKRWAERALIVSGGAGIASRRLRGRSIVLAYHNIVPRGTQTRGDSSLHLPQHEFGRQLDVLSQSHDVVTVDELFEKKPNRSHARVAITFDEA